MKTTHMTDQQHRAFIDAAEAIAEVIKHHTQHPSMGLTGIPSGHLYARLMGHMSFDTYRSFILYLIHTQTIEQDGFHMLRYIRPDQPFPETDDAIAAAKRITARMKARETEIDSDDIPPHEYMEMIH
jgi:hypothetical protein